jgi:S1-C subfamily serine protease
VILFRVDKSEITMRKDKNDNFGFTFSVYGTTIVVDSVEPGSVADMAGLHADDVVLSVNNMRVEDSNLNYLVDALKRPRKNLILEVPYFINVFTILFEFYSNGFLN